MTAQDLIYAALRVVGFTRAGQTNGPELLADGLMFLNGLIDASNAQRAQLFSERMDLLTLTPSQQSYTIGIDPTATYTADFNAPRPTRIDRANLLLSSTVRRPIHPWDFRRWAEVRYQQVYAPPRGMYFDAGFGQGSTPGFGTMYFYPIPDAAYQWEMYSWRQFAQIAALTTTLLIPPAYYEFWLYSLAMRLAPTVNREWSPANAELLRQARETVASLNCPSPELKMQSELQQTGGGLYNWLDGQEEID